MIASDLHAMGAGFSNLAKGSQRVFRSAMESMAQPGRCTPLTHDAQPPAWVDPSAAVLLLSLLDSDCTLWGSPRLQDSDALHWLRFHTGCTLTSEPKSAQFAWIAQGDALPELTLFAQGSDTFPDQSLTCVIEVQSLSNAIAPDRLALTGPGIESVTYLHASGLGNSFLANWEKNVAQFPRGVDVFLTATQFLVGLPRTTHITAHDRVPLEK